MRNAAKINQSSENIDNVKRILKQAEAERREALQLRDEAAKREHNATVALAGGGNRKQTSMRST